MHWGNPNILWGLLLAPAVALFFLWSERAKQKTKFKFGNLKLVELLESNHSPQKAFRKKTLLLAAISFLIICLAQPQWGSQLVEVKKQGVDLVFAVDVSSSMLAEDILPNRLERSKLEISNLLDKLQGDRVGLVGFAGAAHILSPLTLDYRSAQLLLENLQAGMISTPGTNLKEAIATSALAFNKEEKKYKALIIVTDGEDQENQPLEAAEQAAREGIKIITIGVGTPSGEPIPLREPSGRFLGYKKDQTGQVVVSRLNEALLTEIAAATHGKYYAAASSFNLDQIFKEISQMEKKELKGNLAVEYQERYQYLLFIIILLLMLELFASDRKTFKPQVTAPMVQFKTASTAAVLLVLFTSGAFAKNTTAQLNSDANNKFGQKQFDQAIELYQKAAVERPESFPLQYNLGNAFQEKEDYSGAQKTYSRALELADSSHPADVQHLADTHYNLGNNFYRQQLYPQAIDAYKKALRLNPRDKDAKHNLELALSKLQQEQQEKSEKSQDQKDKSQKSKDKNQKNQQPDQKQEREKDQNQKQPSQDQRSQDQKSQTGEKEKDNQDKQNQPNPTQPQLNKQEAERILQALEQKEKQRKQEEMKNAQKAALKSGKGRDW